MNVIYKTDGNTYIKYETTKNQIIFGDEDLSINIKNREMDETVTFDICSDRNGFLVVGAASGYRYVAQVEIPAREYDENTVESTDEEGNIITQIERTAKPFDINKCTLYLWAMEG